MSRVIVFTGDLAARDLGLDETQTSHLLLRLTHLIHAAYTVNFNLSLQLFEPHIAITHNLLSLTASVKRSLPAQFIFCSSTAAVGSTQGCYNIPSARVSFPHDNPATGYGQSKLVCERIIEAAAQKSRARATILRIGEVVPSLVRGSQSWDRNQATLLLVRSALHVGVLPDSLGSQDAMAWLPVDVVSRIVLELSGLWDNDQTLVSDTNQIDPRDESSQKNPQLFYNLTSPRHFSWLDDALPALRAAGLSFEIVPWSEWLARMHDSDLDPRRYPGVKLLEYWEKKRHETSRYQPTDCLEVHDHHRRGKEATFDTQATERDSVHFGYAPDIVKDGYLDLLAREALRSSNGDERRQ